MVAFDVYIVSKTDSAIIRECPFCDAHVEDMLGESTRFIAHLTSPMPRHREKKEWAGYIASINRASGSRATSRAGDDGSGEKKSS
jgi:hypothetical protein